MVVQSGLRLGGYQGEKSLLTAGLAKFHESLVAQTNEFDIERINDVTESGETARGLFDALDAGEFQVGYMASGYLTAKVPQLAVLDLPFSVTDRRAAYRALDGDVGRILAQAVRAQTRYCVLGFWDNGYRHLTSRNRPIRCPRDCKGLIVRTLDNATYVETMAAMGFEPVVTDVRDLREAVESGRVDAQENPLANSVLFDIHHHHPHVSLTGHFFGVMLFLANASWFDCLSHGQKVAVCNAADAATKLQRVMAQEQDKTALKTLVEAGATVIVPDLAAFRKACAHIIERERQALPSSLLEGYCTP